MLADILLLNTRIVRLIRDLGNWLIACYTSQCITTHRAETRQCGRVITHSWIIGHIGGDTRSLSYSVAQVFSFSAVCVKLLNCVACPANVEKFGGRAVFLRVQHIGTGVEVSLNVNYVLMVLKIPFGAESEDDLAADFLLGGLASSRRVWGRHFA